MSKDKDLLDAIIAWMKRSGKSKGFTPEDFDRLASRWSVHQEQFFAAFQPKPKPVPARKPRSEAETSTSRGYLRDLHRLRETDADRATILIDVFERLQADRTYFPDLKKLRAFLNTMRIALPEKTTRANAHAKLVQTLETMPIERLRSFHAEFDAAMRGEILSEHAKWDRIISGSRGER